MTSALLSNRGTLAGSKGSLEIVLFLLNNTNLVHKLGARVFNLLPSIEDLFSGAVDFSRWQLSPDEILRIKCKDWRGVDESLRWGSKEDQRIISFHEDSYPKLLKEISNPPALLFAKGNVELLDADQVAVVGTRNPTPSGIKIATDFAKELSACGLTVTSGFARGIDAAAHSGAMVELGKTIAVLGSGFNHIYPISNRSLADNILFNGGLIISEFSLAKRAAVWHFPLRNRLISGLSLGTVVVEAALKSGSLVTAKLAVEQGREVFAVPGSIYNAQAKGSNYLIKQGAKLVTGIEDILDEFPRFRSIDRVKKISQIESNESDRLDFLHEQLLKCVGFELTTLEEIVSSVDLPISQINTILLELKLCGKITEFMGCYQRLG